MEIDMPREAPIGTLQMYLQYKVPSKSDSYTALNYDWKAGEILAMSLECTQADGVKIAEKFRSYNPSAGSTTWTGSQEV